MGSQHHAWCPKLRVFTTPCMVSQTPRLHNNMHGIPNSACSQHHAWCPKLRVFTTPCMVSQTLRVHNTMHGVPNSMCSQHHAWCPKLDMMFTTPIHARFLCKRNRDNTTGKATVNKFTDFHRLLSKNCLCVCGFTKRTMLNIRPLSCLMPPKSVHVLTSCECFEKTKTNKRSCINLLCFEK